MEGDKALLRALGAAQMNLGRLSRTNAMCWAASEGNVDALRRLREHGADVNASDYDKRTPLHIAVSDGQAEVVEFLLQAGARTDVVDRWGRTPADCALETKNVAILRLLERVQYASATWDLSALGADMKRTEPTVLKRSRSSTDIGTFFRAIQEGNTERVKRSWLEGLGVDVTDENGRTSLHVAVENAQLSVIELLLSADANTNVVDAHGRSPLSIALEKQHFGIAEMLRAHQKQKMMLRSNIIEDQRHVAHAFRAAKIGDLEQLRMLVPQRVSPDTQDYDLRTLLHIASAEGNFAIVKYLVECGANVNLLDRWGTSALSDAIDFAHNDIARFLIANNANESGYRAAIAVDQIDTMTLNAALEYILRLTTRNHWLMGQVHCPTHVGDENCVLAAHSIWQKNADLASYNGSLRNSLTSTSEPQNPESKWPTLIQNFRKVASVMMVDPGQGHTGSVFSAQHPEWLNLNTIQQSQYFLLPHARQARLQTVMSVPMIYKMSTVAVLSWYSDRVIPEDASELQRIQRVLRSVTILAALRQDLLAARASVPNGLKRIPRFQYCQTLDNAITANGELTSDAATANDLLVGDCLPLALEWELFDFVHTLATSMNSEDHHAVLPLLRSLVSLVRNGSFLDELVAHKSSDSSDGKPMKNRDPSLERLIDTSHGEIRSKWSLLGHLKYYLHYLYAVSPTEGNILMEANSLLQVVEKKLKGDTETSTESSAAASTPTPMEVEVVQPKSAPGKPPRHPEPECVLCKYNVPGHIHPGRAPPKPSTPRRVPFQTATSKTLGGDSFFGIKTNPKSPVYREIEQFLDQVASEYDAFDRISALVTAVETDKPAMFTSSDVYDAIGAAHDMPPSSRSRAALDQRKQTLEVLNEIVTDTSSLITYDQLFALHRTLIPASSGQAGVLRTSTAVGYASPRIYRVFLPAGEVADALRRLVDTINDAARWQQRPLLCAYYAFAVLVFYIHPFHDGNGRCARLLGNLVARKLGFPSVLRASDKTIQTNEFLQRAVVTMEMLRTNRRQTRQARVLSSRKETASMWF